MASQKKAIDPKKYAKNLLRSTKYISVELLKGIDPTLTSFISDTKSDIKDMYQDIKDAKRGGDNLFKDLFGKAYKEVNHHKKNILDDIRTGKFYNPERENESQLQYMKNEMGFDFDEMLSFDFDVDEDFGEEKSSNDGFNKENKSPFVTGFESMSRVQQKMSAASSEEITRNADKNTKTSIIASARLFGQVNNSLAIINNSITMFHKDLAGPLNTHIKNSSNFYQTTTDLLARQTALLENINNLLTDRFAPQRGGFSGGHGRTMWEEVFSGGLPNIKKLGKHAKDQILNTGFIGMIRSAFDSNMLKMGKDGGMFDSPIAMLLTMALQDRVNNSAIGKSVTRFSNKMQGGIQYLFSRISKYNRSSWAKDKYGNRKNKNDVLGFLANLFDFAPTFDAGHADTSNYNKGRVDWSGIDNKALTEVIPTQLAKIISILSGEEAEIFDYKSGKWVKSSTISHRFNKDLNKAIGGAAGSFTSDSTKNFIDDSAAAGKNFNYASRATISFKKDLQSVLQYLVLNNISISDMTQSDFNKMLSRLVSTNYIDRRNKEPIKKALFSNSDRRFDVENVTNAGKIAANKFYASSATDSVYGHLYNDSGVLGKRKEGYKNTIFGAQDEHGNTIFTYLQHFYSQLEAIKYYTSIGGVGGGGKRKGSSKPPSFEVPKNQKNIRNSFSSGYIDPRDPGSLTRKNQYDTWNESTEEWEKTEKKSGATSKVDQKKDKGNFISRGLDNLGDLISGIFIGNSPINDVIAEKGILGALKDIPSALKSGIDKLQEAISNWAKNTWESFKESDFGKAFFGNIKDTFKNTGKSVFNHGKKVAGDFWQAGTGKRSGWAGEVVSPTAARGGYVKKSGMVSVSEGELIIPSEGNPFYGGKTNKSSQIRNESKNYNDWLSDGGDDEDYWGSFARGGSPKKNKKKNKKKNTNKKKKNGFQKAQDVVKMAESAVETASDVVKDKAKSFGQKIMDSDAGPIIQEVAYAIQNKVSASMKTLLGDNYDDAESLAKEAVKTVKDNAPKTAASGAIGAIVGGALTGSGLGLMGGMVIGAGISIIKNSDKINKYLFDSENADGTINKGKLPQGLQKFIKNQLPDLAKSGALGSVFAALTGKVPGGLLGGFVLGAGIQLLSNNEYLKNKALGFLFGDKDVDGERHGGIFGSIKARVIDPVADWVKDGLSNIGDYFKKNFISPLLRFFDPLKDWVSGKAIKMMEGIGKTIKNAAGKVVSTLAQKIDTIFGGIFSKLFGAAKQLIKLPGFLASLPFKALGAAGDAMEGHNIKRGYSTKSAKDRVRIAAEKGMTDYSNSGYNKALAGFGEDSQEGQKLIQDVNFFANGKRSAANAIDEERQQLLNTTIASMKNGGMGNSKLRKEIRKRFNSKDVRNAGGIDSGKKGGLIDYISNLSDDTIDPQKKTALLARLRGADIGLRNKHKKLADFDTAQFDFFDKHRELGVMTQSGRLDKDALTALGMQSRRDMETLSGNLKDNLKWNNTLGFAQIEKEKALKNAEKTDVLGKKRNDILTHILDFVHLIGNKMGVHVDDKKLNAIEGLSSTTNGLSSQDESGHEDGDTQQITDSDGNLITQVWNKGKWENDDSDSDTNKIMKDKEEDKSLRKKFYSMFVNGGLLASLTGLFSNKDDKSDKGGGILSKLWGGVTSIAGTIGSTISGVLGSVFGTGGIFGTISSVLSTISSSITAAGGLKALLSSAFKAAVPAVIAGVVIKLGLDKLIDVSDESAGTETDEEMKGYDDASEEEKEEIYNAAIEKQKNRGVISKVFHGANSLEYKLLGKNMMTYGKDDYVSDTVADRLKFNIGKNAVITALNPTSATGRMTAKMLKGGVVSKVAAVAANPIGSAQLIGSKAYNAVSPAVSTIGKGVSKAATTVSTAASKVGTKLASTSAAKTVAKVTDSASTVVATLASKIKSVLTTVASKVGLNFGDDAAESIVATMCKKVSGFASGAATALKAVGAALQWVVVINAITEALQSAGAKEILGILDEPSFGQKALAAVIHGVNNAIPVIGGLIPSSTMFDVFYAVLKDVVDPDGTLGEKRAAAEEEIAAYNEANGTTYDIKEYMYNVLGEATLQTRVGKTVGSAAKVVGKGIKAVGSAIGNAASAVGKGISNVASTAWGGIKSIGGGILNIGSYISEGVSAVVKMGQTMTANMTSGNSDVQDAMATEIEISEDNPFGNIFKGIGGFVKVPIVGINLIRAIGKIVKDKVFTPLVETGKKLISLPVKSATDAMTYVKSGDLKGLWARDSDNGENDGLYGIISTVTDVFSNIGATGPTALMAIGNKIKSLIQTVKEGAIKVGQTGIASYTALKPYSSSGDLKGLWGVDSDAGTDNPLGFVSSITDTFFKVGLTVPTTFRLIGNKIKSLIQTVKEGAIKVGETVLDSGTTLKEYRDAGDLKGLWTANSDADNEDGENSGALGFISSISDTVFKFAYTIPTAGKAIGNKISEIFSSVKKSIPDFGEFVGDAWEYSDTDKHPDMNSWDSMVDKYKTDQDGIFGGIGNGMLSAFSGIMRVIVNIVRPFRTIGNKVASVVDWLGGAWSSIKNTVSDGIDAVMDTAYGGSSGIHVTQKGNGRKFGSSTIDKNGCGPASAATVLNAYGRNSDINKTANYAIKNGYVAGSSGVGTRASYFGDIFGANGIRTSYTGSQRGIRNAVGSGNPTVLLGQDRSNKSKANSPFGPNPHYVVARGTDSRGNVVIDDPELGGTALYDKSILNSAKLAVATGGASNLLFGSRASTASSMVSNKLNTSSSGTVFEKNQQTSTKLAAQAASKSSSTNSASSSGTASSNEEAIWGYYKSRGLSDHAVAGILGNLRHESIKFNPTSTETGFMNRLKGLTYKGNATDSKFASVGNIYSDVGVDISSQENFNKTYTAAVDSGKISREEFMRPYSKLNSSTFSSNGELGHQFGYGLPQFTYKSYKADLYDTAKKNNTSVGDLLTQTEVLYKHLEDTGVMPLLQNSNINYAQAAEYMLKKYERPADTAGQLPIRINSAKDYYEKYTGKTFDISGYTSSDGTYSIGDSSSSSSSSSSSGLSGILSNVFSKVFSTAANSLTGAAKTVANWIFGSSDSSSSSSSSYNIDNTVTGSTSGGGIAKSVDSSLYGKGTPEAFVKIAQSQLGVVEGNNNYTDYGKFTGTPNSAWCAAFVSWAMNQAVGGDSNKLNTVLRGGKTAAVQTFWDRFKAANAMSSTPQVGDVVIYKNNGKSHTGLVESVDGNKITTIEGNTSGGSGFSANGGMVARKSFDITDSSSKAKYLTGFGRPDWSAISGGSSGLPIYNFTNRDYAYKMYRAGSSGIKAKGDMGSIADSTTSGINYSHLSDEKKMQQILIYLKQLVSNTGYNVSIPEIVDVLRDQAEIISNIKSGTTVVSQTESATSKDKQNEIDADITKMMAKLDAITQAL